MIPRLGLSLLSLALPAVATQMSVNDPVELPVDPSLYLCDGVAFEGSCVYFPITYGECSKSIFLDMCIPSSGH